MASTGERRSWWSYLRRGREGIGWLESPKGKGNLCGGSTAPRVHIIPKTFNEDDNKSMIKIPTTPDSAVKIL